MKKSIVLSILVLASNAVSSQNVIEYHNLDSAKRDKKNEIILDLKDQNFKSIPTAIFTMTNVTVLDISQNEIGTIPKDINKMGKLEELYISKDAMKQVSVDIFKLKNLKKIDLIDKNIAENNKTIGDNTVLETAIYLKSINDTAGFNEIMRAKNINFLAKSISRKPYEFASHAFGYIDPGKPTELKDATNITSKAILKNQKVKISLDMLYVHDYPGNGKHKVLFEFTAKNQLSGSEETIKYNQTRDVSDEEFAGIRSIPIFIGLNVGNTGVEFSCKTYNVSNENDEKFLSILESDVFKSGVQLLNTANPVIPIVTGFATGIATEIGKRNQNILVQNFDLGLDFSTIGTRAKLAEGTYIAVQVDNLAAWDWTEWEYKQAGGVIVNKLNKNKTFPFNYVVFSVSKA